jgi:hypothetical protein
MRTYGLSGEFRADSAAKKLVAMEEPHLRHVARIVTQHHALADIRGEGGVDVAHALETHAIHMDFAGFGDRQKQQAAESALRERPISPRLNRTGVGDDDPTIIDRIG